MIKLQKGEKTCNRCGDMEYRALEGGGYILLGVKCSLISHQFIHGLGLLQLLLQLQVEHCTCHY